MILKDIYFFEETNQIGDSKILINENKGDMLSLQVNCEGNFNFEVQGCIDIVSDTYNKVFATNMLTSERQENITSNGIYQIDIDGYRRIKLVLNSIGSQPITVYGVMKEENGDIDIEDDIATKDYVNAAISGKEDASNKVTSINNNSTDTQYPSAKCVYDNLITKQDTLISGTNIKTINNQSILGSGNITISGGSSSPYIYTGTNTADDIEAFESIIDEYNQTGKWDLDYIIYKNTTVMKDVQIRMNEATLLSSTSYVKSYRFIFKGDYQATNTQYNTTLYGKATVVWLNGDYSINFEVETVDNIAPLDNNLQYDRKVLTTDNTTSFTPTNDYHPATKKYVDDIVGDINTVLSSLVTVGGGN